MPEFGQLLELLYGAHRDVDAMFVETRDWGRQDPSDTLTVQQDADGRVRIRWMGGGPYGRPVAGGRRLWFEPPDRIRIELLQRGVVVRTAVRDGDAWWRWDRDDGETAGDLTQGAALPPILDLPLLTPARLLSTMWFEVTGKGTRAGRAVLAASAIPRQTTSGVERYFEFEFDLEHGTPLRTTAFEAGEQINVTEILAVDYAPQITDTTFIFAKPPNNDSQGSIVPAPPSHPSELTQTYTASQQSFTVPQAVLASHQTIWLTGLPCAGKTTIARATDRLLQHLGARSCVLDGDEIRQGLSSDLGLSRDDRGEQARRVAHVAALLADSGVVPIVALVSPFAADRELARKIHEAAGVGFVEVWVDTPLEVCIARDPKGLYAAARDASNGSDPGALADGSGVTGFAAPYEAPANADLRVAGDQDHPRVVATQIVENMFSRPVQSHVLSLGESTTSL